MSGGHGIRTHEDGEGPALELFKSSPFGHSGSPPGSASLPRSDGSVRRGSTSVVNLAAGFNVAEPRDPHVVGR